MENSISYDSGDAGAGSWRFNAYRFAQPALICRTRKLSWSRRGVSTDGLVSVGWIQNARQHSPIPVSSVGVTSPSRGTNGASGPTNPEQLLAASTVFSSSPTIQPAATRTFDQVLDVRCYANGVRRCFLPRRSSRL